MSQGHKRTIITEIKMYAREFPEKENGPEKNYWKEKVSNFENLAKDINVKIQEVKQAEVK